MSVATTMMVERVEDRLITVVRNGEDLQDLLDLLRTEAERDLLRGRVLVVLTESKPKGYRIDGERKIE